MKCGKIGAVTVAAKNKITASLYSIHANGAMLADSRFGLPESWGDVCTRMKQTEGYFTHRGGLANQPHRPHRHKPEAVCPIANLVAQLRPPTPKSGKISVSTGVHDQSPHFPLRCCLVGPCKMASTTVRGQAVSPGRSHRSPCWERRLSCRATAYR